MNQAVNKEGGKLNHPLLTQDRRCPSHGRVFAGTNWRSEPDWESAQSARNRKLPQCRENNIAIRASYGPSVSAVGPRTKYKVESPDGLPDGRSGCLPKGRRAGPRQQIPTKSPELAVPG